MGFDVVGILEPRFGEVDAGLHFGRTARRARRETFALEVRQRSHAAVGTGHDLVRVIVQARQYADVLVGSISTLRII